MQGHYGSRRFPEQGPHCLQLGAIRSPGVSGQAIQWVYACAILDGRNTHDFNSQKLQKDTHVIPYNLSS